MENEPQNIEEPKPQPVIEPVAQSTQHSMRNVVLGVSLVLIIAAIAALWYWFKVYQKPVVTTNTPAPIVKEEEIETPKKSIFFYTAVTSGTATITLFNYDGATTAPKKVADSDSKIQGYMFGASNSKIYYDDGKGLNEYDIATKQTKSLVDSREKFIFVRTSLSPDKSKILYNEICYSDCTANNPNPVGVVKIYDIKTSTITVALEDSNAVGTFKTIGERWINNNLILLSSFCECDGLPPQKQAEVYNIATGTKTTIALETSPVVKGVDISPNGKLIAYLVTVIATPDQQNTKYTSLIKVKDIESGDSETIITSSTQYTDRVFWKDNKTLVYSNHITDSVTAGPGGYYADGGTHNISSVSIKDPSTAKVITSNKSQYGDDEIGYIDEDILIISENNSINDKGVYKENFSHYVYNFETATKELIAKDTLRWTFLK